jgi:hypothetical protein
MEHIKICHCAHFTTHSQIRALPKSTPNSSQITSLGTTPYTQHSSYYVKHFKHFSLYLEMPPLCIHESKKPFDISNVDLLPLKLSTLHTVLYTRQGGLLSWVSPTFQAYTLKPLKPLKPSELRAGPLKQAFPCMYI